MHLYKLSGLEQHIFVLGLLLISIIASANIAYMMKLVFEDPEDRFSFIFWFFISVAIFIFLFYAKVLGHAMDKCLLI